MSFFSYWGSTSWVTCPCSSAVINSRMSACNAHNQELQRKVSQLEKRNMWGTWKWDFSFPNNSSFEISASVSRLDILTDSHPAGNTLRLKASIRQSALCQWSYIQSSFFLSFFLVEHRSLMEQLRRLQALIMSTSNKPVQTGTCVLVCFFSLHLPQNRQLQSGHLR